MAGRSGPDLRRTADGWAVSERGGSRGGPSPEPAPGAPGAAESAGRPCAVC